MQIVIIATGTRGDVQPMIALGMALRDAGHHVRLMAGSNFTSWVESYGLEAYPTTDIEALMRSDLGVKWVESPNGMKQLQAMKALLDTIIPETVQFHIDGTRGADLMISGFVSEPFVQSVSEKTGIPMISTMLQPVRRSAYGAATMVPIIPRGKSFLNGLVGMLAERLTWGVAEDANAALRKALDLPPMDVRGWQKAVRRIPALYGISQYIIPVTDDPNVHVTGYWFLDEDYTPPPELTAFIDAGEPPVYIGFGSMSSSDPQRTLRMTADALTQVGRRGVLARGWGVNATTDLPDHLYLLDKAPHNWLFPRMAAVVHHGGAGTTAAGLRAGVPAVIVPHMADQPYWGRRVHELGVGAKPIPRHKLTTETLAAALREVLENTRIRENTAALGAKIRSERGVENAVKWIQTFTRS